MSERRNDWTRWIIIALLAGGGATTGTAITGRVQGSAAITATDWLKLTLEVSRLHTAITDLRAEVRHLATRLARGDE
jgi:hypothetical protein